MGKFFRRKKATKRILAVNRGQIWRRALRSWQLYLLILPTLVYYFIFHYIPLYGIQIAFKDFSLFKGIHDSPWAKMSGMKNFYDFVTGYSFWPLVRNTVVISVYSIIAGFPAPIFLALMLNEVRNNKFKKAVQNITYAPHFISTVVMVGMILTFLAPERGVVNAAIRAFGGEPIRFMHRIDLFRHIYVWSGVWQGMGWGSIIYLAALAGVDQELHEAAIVDGATRFQRVRYINIPAIKPTMVIILILNCGSVMSVGFEKIYLLQNNINRPVSEVISTYVYSMGILSAQYGYTTAIGLFNSVINLILLIIVNRIARRVNETSLW